MKKLTISILIVLVPFFSIGQTYQYIPLNLDSSSFWIQEYFSYYGAPYVSVKGEVLQYVEGDTIINSLVYHKIRGYCTRFDNGSTYSPLERRMLACYNLSMLIREDTIGKIVYLRYNNVDTPLISYDLNINDSISHMPSIWAWAYAPIDSITIENYFNVNRKSYFANTFAPAYIRIEGIGATYNFPDFEVGEWGTPVFTLNSYVKNNTVLYKRDTYPIDSCYRKPALNSCWPTTVNDNKLSDQSIIYTGERIVIKQNGKLTIHLTSINGARIFSEQAISNYDRDLSYYPKGVYILTVQSSKGVEHKKILVQ